MRERIITVRVYVAGTRQKSCAHDTARRWNPSVRERAFLHPRSGVQRAMRGRDIHMRVRFFVLDEKYTFESDFSRTLVYDFFWRQKRIATTDNGDGYTVTNYCIID